MPGAEDKLSGAINNLCWALLAQESDIQTTLEGLKHFPGGVDHKTLAGYSAIYYAVKMGNIDVVRKLIELGADVRAEYDGLTLRDLAEQEIIMGGEQKKYQEIAALLQAYNVSFSEQNNEEFRKQFNQLNQKAKRYAQAPIKDLMSKKNYELSIGYCYGMSWMGAQAFLLEDRDADGNLLHFKHFAERAQYLWRNYSDLYRQIDRSDHKRKLLVECAKIKAKREAIPADEQQQYINKYVNENLNDKDKMNLEIDPFLNGIELFQRMFKHKQLYEGQKQKKTNINIEATKLVSNAELEEKHGCVVIADHFKYQSNLQGLTNLLKEVERLADSNKYQYPIVFELNANDHSIIIGYDPIKKAWQGINISKTQDMLNSYSAKEMAEFARKSLKLKNANKKKTIEINILSTAKRAEDLERAIIKPLKPFYMPNNFIERNKDKLKTAGIVFFGSLVIAGLIAGAVLSGGVLSILIPCGVAAMLCLGGEGCFLINKYYDYKESKLKRNLINKHLTESIAKYKGKNDDKVPYSTAGIINSSSNFDEMKDSSKEALQPVTQKSELTVRPESPVVTARQASNQKLFGQTDEKSKPRTDNNSTWGKCCGFIGQIFK